jgi:dihydroneopterin aldolase
MIKHRGKIRLEGMEFYAHHGYFKEEQVLGNRFTVDIELETDYVEAAIDDDLSKTADYTKVYSIISVVMETKVSLLEHLAYKINNEVLALLPSVLSVSVTVSKQNPPIGGVCAAAKVSLTSHR